MKLLAVLALCCSLAAVAQAHIHSQKVRHIERDKLTLNTWICALVSSALVGVCGVFPLVVNRYVKLDSGSKHRLAFKALLSFAVGGLLGDVFLHLLPEAYGTGNIGAGEPGGMAIGLWVLVGFMSFLTVEKVMKITDIDEESSTSATDGEKELNFERISSNTNSNCNSVNGMAKTVIGNGLARRKLQTNVANGTQNGFTASLSSNHTKPSPLLTSTHPSPSLSSVPPPSRSSSWFDKDTSGYLNLVANSTDNFTHGLAIAASYVASPMVGMLTTLAILCHEIPHEVGDFAILLKSGFSLREAAKAQILTACGGLVGVVTGLTAEHMSSASTWLLPFTAGGFLYIALVSIIPDLLECSSIRHCLTELFALGVGVVVMALVTIIERKSCGHMPSIALSVDSGIGS